MQQAQETYQRLSWLELFFYLLKVAPKGQPSFILYPLFRCTIPTFYHHSFTTFYPYPFFIPDNPDTSISSGFKALFHKVKNNTLATQVEMFYIAGCHILQKSKLIFIASFSCVVRDRRGYGNRFIMQCFCYLFKNLFMK